MLRGDLLPSLFIFANGKTSIQIKAQFSPHRGGIHWFLFLCGQGGGGSVFGEAGEDYQKAATQNSFFLPSLL